MNRSIAALLLVLFLGSCGEQSDSSPGHWPTGDSTGLNAKLMESFAACPEVDRLAAELLTTLYAGEAAMVRDNLGNDAFREAATLEQIEQVVALLQETLERPGEPNLQFYKTDVMGEGILAMAVYDVTFAKGKGQLQLRARKTGDRWLVEGFNLSSPLFGK